MRDKASSVASGLYRVVIAATLLLVAVTVANAEKGNPLGEILDKLDEIIATLNNAGSGASNHTLRWDQNLPGASRFTVLAAFANQAVLDKNTGLVWEQAPSTTTAVFQDSTYGCANKVIGGQKGWRLPAIPELASLIDPSIATPGPTLPPGHPFTNVQSAFYWSATTHAVNNGRATTKTCSGDNPILLEE
jgi:hypothetical protein